MNFVRDYYSFESRISDRDARLISKMVDVIDRAKSLIDCMAFYESSKHENKESARQTFYRSRKYLESGIYELENLKAGGK